MNRKEIRSSGPFTTLPLCVLTTRLLHPTSKVVYAALIDRLGEKEYTYPSHNQLAEDCGLSERTVKRAVAELKISGLVEYEVRKNKVNKYVLTDPAVALENATFAPAVGQPVIPAVGQAGLVKVKSGCQAVIPVGQADTPKPVGQVVIPVGQAVPPGCQAVPPGCQAGPSAGQADPRNQKKNQKTQPRNLTRKLNHLPPAAAARASRIQPSLGQGYDPDFQERWASLIRLWKRRKLKLPSKLETCKKLLAAEEREAGETLDADSIPSGVPLDFINLMKRTHSGRYYWQELKVSAAAEKDRKPASVSDSQIEEVYDCYPRRIKKTAAITEIKKAIRLLQRNDPTQDAVAFLLEKVQKFAASPAGNKGVYTPFASNWFADGRYLDDEAEWGITANRSGGLRRTTEPIDETPGESLDDFIAREVGPEYVQH